MSKENRIKRSIFEVLIACLLFFLTVSVIFLLSQHANKTQEEIFIGENGTNFNRILDSQQKQLNEIQFVVDKFHDNNYTASNGKNFLLSVTQMSYRTAESFCRKNGGLLICEGRRDPVIWKEITENMQLLMEKENIWVGLTDLDEEGVWVWADGVEATSGNTDWNPGEPNNYYDVEDCADIIKTRDFKLNDGPCDALFYALCEI